MKTSKLIAPIVFSACIFSTVPTQAGILGGILKAIKGAANGIAQQYGLQLDTLTKAAEQLDKVKEEVQTAHNIYDQTKGQLDTLKELKSMSQRKYGWGDLLNSADDLNRLKYTASSWNETVGRLDRNSDRYQKLMEDYTQQHNDISDAEFKKGATEKALKQYKQSKMLTASADAQATTAYNDINKRLENIHKLTKKIEKTDSPKSSADLNSRLVAENANVQTEVLRQLAILNKQSALTNEKKLQDDAVAAREAAKRAEFNRLPDEKSE